MISADSFIIFLKESKFIAEFNQKLQTLFEVNLNSIENFPENFDYKCLLMMKFVRPLKWNEVVWNEIKLVKTRWWW